jgi:intracellular multiplication protein IcmX
MKYRNGFKLSLLCSLLLSHVALADDYILKWAAFTGYNLSNDAPTAPLSTLLSATNTALAQQYSLLTLFGALTVNAVSTNFSAFAPSDSAYGKLLNPYANATFTEFKNPGSSTGVSISSLIDQTDSPQNDPVSQFITDVLTTPNMTYCLNNDGTAWVSNCEYKLYDSLISFNILGNTIPGPTQYFSYEYNQAVIPQLNSATLLSPLQYSTANASSQSGSSSQNTTKAGLTASNQLQEATNFIRYLSSALVKPIPAVQFSDYNDAYTAATDTSSTASPINVSNARNSISNYIADVRTYAAQMSIALNNLYGMLSSRMPQTQANGSSTSSALSLFQLATRRLYDPSASADKQWISQLDNASSATVNKEIAATMADILYMLYVLHQDNERQLLTNSAMLINSAHQPSFRQPDLNTVGSNPVPAS